MTDTKSEARFSLDDVIVIRTPNDCKMCERRVNTYVENVKDWQRQYDEILAKHERVLQMLDIAEGAMTNCRMQFADMMSRVKAPDAWMIQELDEALDHIKGLKK